MRTFTPFSIVARLAAVADGCLHGPALDTITSTGTAINTTLAALTIAAGDSFQIKNQAANNPALLLQMWVDNQAVGEVRVRSPKMHDNVDAIRSRILVGILEPLLPWGMPQLLYPQDVITVELAGSATAGDIESVVLQVYYPDLPGQNANLATWESVKPRIKNIVGQRIAITLGSTAGYNGARAINADADLLKANTNYALLGGSTNTEAAAICVRGPDTGNLRVSFPGEPGLIHHTNYWFKRLSIAYGLPLIPIINSANKGGTLVDAVNDENGGTANVVLWLAELGS